MEFNVFIKKFKNLDPPTNIYQKEAEIKKKYLPLQYWILPLLNLKYI